MTRTDYELVAETIREVARNWTGTIAQRVLEVDLAVNLADALEADNPRFDRERFLKACGAQ